jgi:hypothetical protein
MFFYALQANPEWLLSVGPDATVNPEPAISEFQTENNRPRTDAPLLIPRGEDLLESV